MIMEMSKNKAEDFQNFHDLIPGLPYEVALECLIRVPYQFQSAMKSVSRSWRILLSDSSFIKERRRCGKSELLLFLVQPLTPPTPASVAVTETLMLEEKKSEEDDESQPRFRLSVYNSAMSTWHSVAFPKDVQVPLFCECVVLQEIGKILLIGGWDSETLQPTRDVYVLEFAGRKLRRGAPMNESRSFFACASVGSTKVYVAGGHDDQKNALRSAEVYDVEKDEWSTISPMTEGRDECQGFAIGMDLRFCVLSGYGTETQGRFRSDGEIYDPATNSWSKTENIWRFPNTSPRGRTAGDFRSSTRIWYFTETELQRDYTKDDCKLELETIQLPMKTGSSVFAGRLGGEAVVMIGGRRRESEGEGGVMMKMKMKMTMEKKIKKWSHVSIPSEFCTLPFSHASIYV